VWPYRDWGNQLIFDYGIPQVRGLAVITIRGSLLPLIFGKIKGDWDIVLIVGQMSQHSKVLIYALKIGSKLIGWKSDNQI